MMKELCQLNLEFVFKCLMGSDWLVESIPEEGCC